MTIQITRTEFPAAELRHRARVASDPDQARRLLAIASILDGASRTDAAKSAGMERQTLRDWVHRFNAEGVDGLKDRQRSGRKPLLKEEQRAKLDELVETPPDPVKDGVVRWRCNDLKAKRVLIFAFRSLQRQRTTPSFTGSGGVSTSCSALHAAPP